VHNWWHSRASALARRFAQAVGAASTADGATDPIIATLVDASTQLPGWQQRWARGAHVQRPSWLALPHLRAAAVAGQALPASGAAAVGQRVVLAGQVALLVDECAARAATLRPLCQLDALLWAAGADLRGDPHTAVLGVDHQQVAIHNVQAVRPLPYVGSVAGPQKVAVGIRQPQVAQLSQCQPDRLLDCGLSDLAPQHAVTSSVHKGQLRVGVGIPAQLVALAGVRKGCPTGEGDEGCGAGCAEVGCAHEP
jgi:hypothetical protein